MGGRYSTGDLRAIRNMNPVAKRLRLDTYLDELLGGPQMTGDVYYCDPTSGLPDHDGKSPDKAVNTLQAAIDFCTDNNGDVIVRMKGGEAVTSVVDFNCPGITVIPQTYGGPMAQMAEFFSTYSTTLTADPTAIVTAANVTIAGMAFVGVDAGTTFYDGAALLLRASLSATATAAPYGARIINCRFPKWNLANRIGIAIDGASNSVIEGCEFEGVGADFASGIYVQGATANLLIQDNIFRDCTYGVLMGAFAGGGPDFVLKSNVFHDSKCLSAGVSSEANPGVCCDNWCNAATDASGGSYNDTVDNLNTGGVVFSDQHYAE